MAIDNLNAEGYDAIVQANLTPNQPAILASEVMAEFEKRCGSGQQYCTFPNTISDEEKAKLEAANYIVTRNTIDSENMDGADSRYIGFQVALNETAAEKALVIGQKGENGIGGGGGSATLIEKTITENGTYKASSDNADGYSKVTVDVSNTYTAQDEGKVVNNGALVAQTAMSSEVTENGTVDTTLYNSVTVNVSSGGSAASKKDVNFYDYDGTVVASYTAAEFANLTAMPDNPSHEGLTAQGWNWSLADAKAYIADYGSLNIGQMYITSDGKTRLYISLPEGRTSPILQLYLNDNSELDIDWGDGGTHSTSTSTSEDYKSERHEYSSSGDYVIAITVVNGGFVLQSLSTTVSNILWNGNDSTRSPDESYNNAIKKIEIGDDVTSIAQYAFNGCYSLSSITIPNTVTGIGIYAFYNCSSLSSITIPNGVTSIGESAFNNCYSLSSVTIPNTVTSIAQYAFQNCRSLSSITIPDGVTSIGDRAFQDCYSLSSVTIPDSVTSIGQQAFYYCYSLSSITIPNGVTSIGGSAFYNCYSLSSITIPNTVTSISDYAFYNCYSLSSVTIPDSVTSIGSYAFNNCYSLSSVTIPDSVTSIAQYAFQACSSLSSITIPDSVTSIGSYAFQTCRSLSSVTIPDSVTSIGNGSFNGCYSLSSITIPDSVTSIGIYAFQYCSYMSYIKFESTTPPRVTSSSTWTDVSTSTKILVPSGTLATYKSARNYPNPSTYTYEEY